jgi:hypothetical protein
MTTSPVQTRRRAETPSEWLEELGAALNMPFERAEAIRDELAEHLRERVRDLELEGLSESAAANTAVRELGDAAAVARRFRYAERLPLRRKLMNLAVIGIAGAALLTSFVAINDGDKPNTEASRLLLERALTAPPEESRLLVERAIVQLEPKLSERNLAEVDLLLRGGTRQVIEGEITFSDTSDRRAIQLGVADIRSSVLHALSDSQEPIKVPALDVRDQPLADVFKWLGEQSGLKLNVRWKQFEHVGIAADEPVTIVGGGGDLGSVMAAINDSREVLNATDERRIDYRVKDGVLEIGPGSYFDKREAFVMRYDIAALLESGVSAAEICALIQGFVEPDHWVDNGGSLASIRLVGTRMFVKAPPRMQESVKWFLEQAGEEKHSRAGEPAEPAQVVQVYHLKHTNAEEVLKAIMTNQQIRAIDFTHFAADARTNSIIGRTSAPEHRIVEDAIEALDIDPKTSASQRTAPVYVLGQVTNPGLYALPDDATTVRRMLAAAGGVKDGIKEVAVRRGQDEHPPVVSTLTAEQLADPAGPDFTLQPGDFISVK